MRHYYTFVVLLLLLAKGSPAPPGTTQSSSSSPSSSGSTINSSPTTANSSGDFASEGLDPNGFPHSAVENPSFHTPNPDSQSRKKRALEDPRTPIIVPSVTSEPPVPCINTTDSYLIGVSISKGYWFCDPMIVAPNWLVFSYISHHTEALFNASTACFFLAFMCYVFLHCLKGRVAYVVSMISSLLVVAGYSCSIAMAALHVSASSTVERHLVLGFVIFVLILVFFKIILHAVLSYRSGSLRAMDPFCNHVAILEGTQMGKTAFTMFFKSTPDIISLASTPSEKGEIIWTISGSSRVVTAKYKVPGGVRLFSFFSKTFLPLRQLVPGKLVPDSTIAMFAKQIFGDPLRVTSDVAKLYATPRESPVYTPVDDFNSDREDEDDDEVYQKPLLSSV